eukprot:2872893-Amphidinium_carterae.1
MEGNQPKHNEPWKRTSPSTVSHGGEPAQAERTEKNPSQQTKRANGGPRHTHTHAPKEKENQDK